MSDHNLESKIVESLESILGYIEQAGEFAAQQAPLVAQEILLWGFWSNFLLGVALLIPFCVFAYAWVGPMRRYAMANGNKSTENWAFGGVVFGILLGIVFCAGVQHLFVALKVTLAPRLYILEYLKGMM